MGILSWITSIILKLLIKKIESEIVRKSLPIIFSILFSLLSIYFFALAAIDFLEKFLPTYLAKLMLGTIFFILAIIFKLWW